MINIKSLFHKSEIEPQQVWLKYNQINYIIQSREFLRSDARVVLASEGVFIYISDYGYWKVGELPNAKLYKPGIWITKKAYGNDWHNVIYAEDNEEVCYMGRIKTYSGIDDNLRYVCKSFEYHDNASNKTWTFNFPEKDDIIGI